MDRDPWKKKCTKMKRWSELAELAELAEQPPVLLLLLTFPFLFLSPKVLQGSRRVVNREIASVCEQPLEALNEGVPSELACALRITCLEKMSFFSGGCMGRDTDMGSEV